MQSSLSDETMHILDRAAEESRNLGHRYVGTEHVLLALLGDGATREILGRFELSAEQIRTVIGSLIQPGADRGPKVEGLPLTPRAQRSVELAAAECGAANQARVEPPHLLLGLVAEGGGVAALALQQLKPALTAPALCEKLFRIRFAQLRLIERTVRPVQASTARKLKMREELLAHLESVYGGELARTQNPDAAFAAAAERFGKPADLSRELQASVPALERLAQHHLAKRFGWRAPERASVYLRRLSLELLALFGGMFAVFACIVIAIHGVVPYAIAILFQGLLIIVVAALSVNLLGNLYFLTRDSLFGVFGSRKSWRRVGVLAGGTFATALAIGASCITARDGSVYAVPPAAGGLAGGALVVTLLSLGFARFRGRVEIQQTRWECLDLAEGD